MAKKRVAHKIEYRVDHDSDTTFTKIASVKRIVDPSKTRDPVDVTDLDDDIEVGEPSPVVKLGDLKLQLYWDEADTAGQGLLEDLHASAAIVNHQIYFPFTTPITKQMAGWVKELGEATYEVKGEVMREVTIHVTSMPATI